MVVCLLLGQWSEREREREREREAFSPNDKITVQEKLILSVFTIFNM